MGMGMGTGRGTITGMHEQGGGGTARSGMGSPNSSSGARHRAIWHHAYRREGETRQGCAGGGGGRVLGFPGMVGVLGGGCGATAGAGAWGWRWGPGFLGRLAGPDAGEHGVGQGAVGVGGVVRRAADEGRAEPAA